jgi:putative ABC transport system permease protein
MLASDLLNISLRQLYRNKRRYKSVILGIALGIAGLVTILTIGDSVESDIGHNLELLGSATILKATFDYDRSTRWHHGQYYPKDLDDIKRLPGVKSVSPAVWNGQSCSRGDKRMHGKVMGVQEDFFETIYIPVGRGRRISAADSAAKASVCVIGQTVVDTLFKEGNDPVGEQILIEGHSFRIIGVIGGVEDKSLFETILIPLSVARSRFPKMYEIKDVYVRAANWDIVGTLHHQILKTLVNNQPGYAQGMEVRYYPERITAIKQAIFLIKLFLYSSIVVTLLLGGLGITNVMLAAVRERTTEIGLRKAVGATEGMILTQFLLESVSISFMGAVFGIVVGFFSVEALKRIINTAPAYNVFLLSLIGGVIFGVLLGMVSGYLPAKKASSLDPADAMRFE